MKIGNIFGKIFGGSESKSTQQASEKKTTVEEPVDKFIDSSNECSVEPCVNLKLKLENKVEEVRDNKYQWMESCDDNDIFGELPNTIAEQENKSISRMRKVELQVSIMEDGECQEITPKVNKYLKLEDKLQESLYKGYRRAYSFDDDDNFRASKEAIRDVVQNDVKYVREVQDQLGFFAKGTM